MSIVISVAQLIGITIKLRCYKVAIIETSLISLMRLSWYVIIANTHAQVNPNPPTTATVVVWFPDCLYLGNDSWVVLSVAG